IEIGPALGRVIWAPDGTRFVVGDERGGVHLFSADGQLLWHRDGGRGWIYGLSWSPDGRRIVSTNGGVRIWDAESGSVSRPCGDAGSPFTVAGSPDGLAIAWPRGNEIRIADAESGRVLCDCVGHQERTEAVTWLPSGHRLASGSTDRSIRVWHSSGQLL